ncbi:MAG: bifunctional 5,10-methylenetetrahydrofolate dehydrogenase/5,10-methenyltetrahydrofolate cyclohydrolase [Microgenomates group bacterium]
MAIIFDGKKLAEEKEKILAQKVAELKKKTGITPKLTAFLIGENPASILYLKKKSEAGKRVGIEVEVVKIKKITSLINLIEEKNNDFKTHGIMVQLPLPEEFKNWELKILESISPIKDVDCLTPVNLGLLARGQPRFLPATVKAVLEIIKNSNFKVLGSNIVVVGASNIVGKPLALLLSNLGATVTLCRSKTKNLAKFTCQADFLISATGVPNLIKAEMVKREAIVIDVGAPKADVDFEKVKKIASFITPVPGGVGPLTVVSLLENLLIAFERTS